MRDKIVTVTLGEDLYVKGPHVFQYDYGLVLVLNGIQLPAEYEVHFSNKKHGVAKKGEATENGVKIPDEYLRSGEDVFAWVYLRNGDTDGYTVYSVQLPVIARAVEQGDNISPVEHNIIDKAIEALEEAVVECEENVRHYPIINNNGNWMLYDAVAGEYVDTGLSAVGEDGFSPTVQITEIEDGNRVTITDAYGDHTFDVLNGESVIDDTAGAGDTDKVWSADKTAAEISSLNDEISEKADASDLQVVPVFSKNGEGVYTCNMPFAEVYAAVNEEKCTACVVLSTLTGKVDICASLVASSSSAIKFSWSEPRPQQEHVYGVVVQFTNDEAVEITSQILSLGDYIAPTYSRTMFPIAAGTYCLKNGGMYKAKEDISRYETFNPEKWGLVDVSTEISAISEELSDIDSDVSEKADKTDTVLNTTLSRGRTDGSPVGEGSFAFGSDVEASGELSFAEGNSTKANGAYSHVGGMYNIPDSYDGFDEWTAGTQYNVGDKVKVTVTENNETTVNGYICKTANSDSSFMPFKWIDMQGRMNYAEIIGNGADENHRSNARALDWEGNEYLAGDLYVRSDIGSDTGSKVATLDAAGKVPTSQLPSYVDDVVEYPSLNEFPSVGESGKIYVAIDTNMTYRWSGSTYIIIGSSLTLGETNSTAYRGDRGKYAYDKAKAMNTATSADVDKCLSPRTVDINGNVTEWQFVEGGISDYAALLNKPKINNVELAGNKTSEDFGIVIPSKVSDLQNDSGFITQETDPTVPGWAKQPTKPSYTAQEVGALPANTSIPTKVSDLQNDSGFITSETDPTVPNWAKQQNKPTYTASEVGALPTNTIDDTAGDGATNKVWSANKTHDEIAEVDNQVIVSDTEPQEVSNKLWIDTEEGQEFTIPTYQEFSQLSGAINGKYTKPETGIPASDLASGVIPDVSGKAD